MSTQARQAKQLFITNHGPGAFPGYFSGGFFGARGTVIPLGIVAFHVSQSKAYKRATIFYTSIKLKIPMKIGRGERLCYWEHFLLFVTLRNDHERDPTLVIHPEITSAIRHLWTVFVDEGVEEQVHHRHVVIQPVELVANQYCRF